MRASRSKKPTKNIDYITLHYSKLYNIFCKMQYISSHILHNIMLVHLPHSYKIPLLYSPFRITPGSCY